MHVTQTILFFSACKNVENNRILSAILDDDEEQEGEDRGKYLVVASVMATCPVEGLGTTMFGCNTPSI